MKTEIKLGCPPLGKAARFAVASESITAHEDRLNCAVVTGGELAAWERFSGHSILMPTCNYTCLSLGPSGSSRDKCPFTFLVVKSQYRLLESCSYPCVFLTCQLPGYSALPEQGPAPKMNFKWV